MSPMTDLIARLPWVTRLDVTQDCSSCRWSHMPLKALRDPEVAAKWKCRARARWQFEALPGSGQNPFPARSGTYCWSHLLTQLRQFGAEEERYKRTMDQLRGQEQ